LSLTSLNKAKNLKKKRINEIIAELDDEVIKAQARLHRELSEKFIAKLTKDASGVISKKENRKLIAGIEKIFADFKTKDELRILKQFIGGVDEVLGINSDYYAEISPDKRLAQLTREVKTEVKAMLGIGDKGKLIKNGYLDKLVKNPAAKMKVKQLAQRKLGKGFFEMRDSMKKLVVGDQKNYGLMQGYYRNYAYDTISQADAVAGKIFADKLGLNFASYDGGIIATSRDFCRERNGNVYHRSQIAKWNPTEARQPDYNPFIHLGGYGCRHFFNWISDDLAVYLEPSMKKFVTNTEK
jgi:hypothetical protein